MSLNEVFTEEEDEVLITLVSEYPILYDLGLEDYKNIRKKDNVWAEIGKIMNKSSNACKKHWKNLKDTYYRQKRKNKSGTGSAAPKNPRSKFNSYAKLFSFLETAQDRPTLGSIQANEITTDESQNIEISCQNRSSLDPHDQAGSSQTILLPPPPPSPTASTSVQPSFPKSTKKRTKKEDILTYLQKREVSRQKVLENMTKKDDNDDSVSFSEHVKVVLKKLTPIRKLQAKREIFDVLMKYELLDVEDTESSRPGTSTSYVSSNNSDSPRPHDTQPDYNQAIYSLVSVGGENLPLYSPISQATLDEEPTDLSFVQINADYFETQ